MEKLTPNELSDETKSSMKTRVISAIIMTAITVPAIILGGWFFLAFTLVVLGLAVFEFVRAPRYNDRYHPIIFVLIYIISYALTYWLMLKNNLANIGFEGGIYEGWSFGGSFITYNQHKNPVATLGLSSIAILTLILVLFLIHIVSSKINFGDVTYLFLMTVFVSLGIQSLLFLRYFPEAYFKTVSATHAYRYNDYSTSTLIIYVLAGTLFTDTGAYFTGVLFGKHKMNPRISPKKTWEGFFGGIIISAIVSITFAAVMSVCDFPILPMLDIREPLNWIYVVLLGVTMPLIATLGDFIFSAIKREFGIKDFSNIIKGHGGVLDRLDSVICVAIFVSCIIVLASSGWSFLN